ncbi:MAG: thioredoxin domain-containing protein [Thermoproteota archaeon]|nr:thioredoxin domain-containing protein [Thermoproteota archaeon]
MDDKDEFTFSIDGKDYKISEKGNSSKKYSKQTLHGPSLAIGAVIAGICIVGVFFGVGDFSESSKELVEKQILEEITSPTEVTFDTFFENGSPILGNPNASITLIEFGDYQCHFCNVYYHNTEHEIFEKYVMTGKVNVIFKDYTIIGQDSVRAAHAAHCAGEQGKFWQYHNTLYDNWGGENSGWADQENIIEFAQQVELNMEDFIDCNVERKFEEKISASNTDANSLGITGTPAFYIISTVNGQVQHIQGAQPYEVFEKIFNTMLEN